MNASQKIHCPSCGIVIEFSSEKEGTTGECPSCKSPVWLSHLAEKDGAPKIHESSQVSAQMHHTSSSSSNSIVIGLLVLLILFNLVLGFQVIQLKGQISQGQQFSSNITKYNPTANQDESRDSIRPGRVGGEGFSNQEAMNELLNTMELLDEDLRAEMVGLQSGYVNHGESINELMQAASQLDTSIESIYEDLSNLSTSLEELSNSLNDVQENQLMLQNLINQSSR
jgi:methyl-accepting chemotaxis protein